MLKSLAETLKKGEEGAKSFAAGNAPDVKILGAHAEALGMLRVGILKRTLHAGWIQPGSEDVEAAHRLAQAPNTGEGCKLAKRVYRVTADPRALAQLYTVLPFLCMDDGATSDRRPTPQQIETAVTEAITLFATSLSEQKSYVTGFFPSRTDLAQLCRLHEISTCKGGSARRERWSLCGQLSNLMPPTEAPCTAQHLIF